MIYYVCVIITSLFINIRETFAGVIFMWPIYCETCEIRSYANSERDKNWVYVFTTATQADKFTDDSNPLNSLRLSDAYMRH